MGPRLLLCAALLANLTSTVLAIAYTDCYRGKSRFSDCALALTYLPNGLTVGEFRRGREGGDFLLPKTSSRGECYVTVDLNGDQRVQGSWQEIWTLANTLITGCSYMRNPGDATSMATGGWIRAGQGNGLKITFADRRAMAIDEPAIAAE